MTTIKEVSPQLQEFVTWCLDNQIQHKLLLSCNGCHAKVFIQDGKNGNRIEIEDNGKADSLNITIFEHSCLFPSTLELHLDKLEMLISCLPELKKE